MKIQHLIPILLLAGNVFHASSFASAAEYEVDGVIEQTIYVSDGSVGGLEKSQFKVFVKDCSWLIQTTDLDNDGKPAARRETACTNGAEVYEVEGPVNGGTTANGRRSSSWNVATIISNNVPVGQTVGYFVSHIWEMFASGCYFQSQSGNWLTPVYDSNASSSVNPNMKVEAKWELLDGPGSLPSSVSYLNYLGMPVVATYTATGVTNAGAIKIPSGFVFEFRVNFRFAPGPIPLGKSVPAYHIRRKAVGTVTAVRPYCSRSDLSPTATGKTIVIDKRPPDYLSQPTNLPHYVVNTGVQWLPLEEAKKAYVVPGTSSKPAQSNSARLKPASSNPAQPEHAPPKPAQSKPFPRVIVAIILLLPLAALSLFLWLKRKKG